MYYTANYLTLIWRCKRQIEGARIVTKAYVNGLYRENDKVSGVLCKIDGNQQNYPFEDYYWC